MIIGLQDVLPVSILLMAMAAQGRPKPHISGILYNEDDSHRFIVAPAGKITPGDLDKLVDDLAQSQVTVLLICDNAKNTAHDSKAWQPQCAGFDPTLGNDQPYFGDVKGEALTVCRQWAENQLVLFQAGVDPMKRMIDRCREKGIHPWISMRMNDVHDADLTRSPLHSPFWLEHHEYWRYPDRFNSWLDRCLDFGQKPVRDHAMALIKELLDYYDMDGLELDWNRFPAHFREGEEIEKGKELTLWMKEVREEVLLAEKRVGHPIWLVARVPARPEVSYGIGLDALTWARQGLVDHLIVAPFWQTTDFDIPVEQWIDLLQGTGVGVTAGLEIRIQPHPSAPVLENTPERSRGAALAHLSRGSQGTYVFNYFDIPLQTPYLLKELGNAKTLVDKKRSVVKTFVDINIPGKGIPPELPRMCGPGESASFNVFVGPKSHVGRVDVSLGLVCDAVGDAIVPEVFLNESGPSFASHPGIFSFEPQSLLEGSNVILVKNTSDAPLRVESVELIVTPGED